MHEEMPFVSQEEDSINLMASYEKLTRLIPDICIDVKHQEDPLTSDSVIQVTESSQRCCIDHEEKKIGVATGNWGCGVFGGDPELKIMLQWIAISQSGRPFMSYYTFGLQALQSLNQVINRVALQEWTVGKLWNKVVEYSAERVNKRKHFGFLSWLIASQSLASEPTLSKVQ